MNYKNKTKPFVFVFERCRDILGDGSLETDIEINNLHLFQVTHWVLIVHEFYFDSYGTTLPKKLFDFIRERSENCSCSENKIQGLTSKRDSFCAAYCLYIISSTKVLGTVV